jgi:hypothetical protein
MTETDSSGNVTKVTGAIWISPSGESFVVYSGDDGLPTRAVIGDYIIIFENYKLGTVNTVDVALIYPNGSYTITRDIVIDVSHFSSSQSLKTSGITTSKAVSAQRQGLSLRDTIQWASMVLAVSGCVAAVIMSAGTASLLCAGAILSIAINLLPEDNVALEGTAVGLGAIGCGIGDTGSCIGLVLQTTGNIMDAAQVTQTNQSSAITQAETALVGATGDISFKLTWTWSNSSRTEGPDIDIWVEDPNGHLLSSSRDGYGLGPCPDGGKIDEDDLGGWGNGDGGGPERVYWPTGLSPTGTYTYGVRYYQGDGTVEYTLRVYKGSTPQTTKTGTLTSPGSRITLGTVIN